MIRIIRRDKVKMEKDPVHDANIRDELMQITEELNRMNNNKEQNKNGKIGEGVKFERIRRITGYLVGTIDRFNDAKASEVKERLKHKVE